MPLLYCLCCCYVPPLLCGFVPAAYAALLKEYFSLQCLLFTNLKCVVKYLYFFSHFYLLGSGRTVATGFVPSPPPVSKRFYLCRAESSEFPVHVEYSSNFANPGPRAICSSRVYATKTSLQARARIQRDLHPHRESRKGEIRVLFSCSIVDVFIFFIVVPLLDPLPRLLCRAQPRALVKRYCRRFAARLLLIC